MLPTTPSSLELKTKRSSEVAEASCLVVGSTWRRGVVMVVVVVEVMVEMVEVEEVVEVVPWAPCPPGGSPGG